MKSAYGINRCHGAFITAVKNAMPFLFLSGMSIFLKNVKLLTRVKNITTKTTTIVEIGNTPASPGKRTKPTTVSQNSSKNSTMSMLLWTIDLIIKVKNASKIRITRTSVRS